MPRVLDQVRALEGKTLKTLKFHRPFRIIQVTPTVVRVLPLEGTRPRRIAVDRIEAIAGMGFNRDELRQRVQEEYPTTQNSSYIAAIVHEVTTLPS